MLACLAPGESSSVHIRTSFKGQFPFFDYFYSDIRPLLSSTNYSCDINSLARSGNWCSLIRLYFMKYSLVVQVRILEAAFEVVLVFNPSLVSTFSQHFCGRQR